MTEPVDYSQFCSSSVSVTEPASHKPHGVQSTLSSTHHPHFQPPIISNLTKDIITFQIARSFPQRAWCRLCPDALTGDYSAWVQGLLASNRHRHLPHKFSTRNPQWHLTQPGWSWVSRCRLQKPIWWPPVRKSGRERERERSEPHLKRLSQSRRRHSPSAS